MVGRGLVQPTHAPAIERDRLNDPQQDAGGGQPLDPAQALSEILREPARPARDGGTKARKDRFARKQAWRRGGHGVEWLTPNALGVLQRSTSRFFRPGST